MAANLKRSTYVVTTKVTVPASTATSSVITAASGANTFSLDAADTDVFSRGAWIYYATTSVKYKILEMASDGLSGVIDGTFSGALSGATISVIKAQDAKVSKIYMATADAVTIIDGANVPASYTINDEVSEVAQDTGNKQVEPYIVDAATNSSSVLVQVYKFPQ